MRPTLNEYPCRLKICVHDIRSKSKRVQEACSIGAPLIAGKEGPGGLLYMSTLAGYKSVYKMQGGLL